MQKHGYAAAVLSKSIEKEYTAVCEGVLKGEGTIDVPIRLKEGYTIQREVAKDGQRAVTHWKVVGVPIIILCCKFVWKQGGHIKFVCIFLT